MKHCSSKMEAQYQLFVLVNKKDPVCEMPISAGISDTTIYKGNILGFCSPECKAEFMKKPADYIAKAELKIK